MAEAVAGGSIENGGPPKAPSPCTKTEPNERPVITTSPSVVSAVGDVNKQSSLEEVSQAAPVEDTSVSPPPESSDITSSIQTNETEDKTVVNESLTTSSTSQVDIHPVLEAVSSASTSGVADASTVPPDNAQTSAPAPYVGGVDVPCMRGRLIAEENGSYLISGTWAMTLASHGTEGHTSPFELRVAAPSLADGSSRCGYSGVYSGFFMLMQGEGKPDLKVDEKRVHLTYIANSDGGFNVQGTGKNRFGQFTMNGTVSSSNEVELFRAYLAKPEKPKTDGRKRGPSGPKITSTPITVNTSVDPVLGSGGSPGGLGGKSIQALSVSIQKPVSEDTEVISPGRAKRANVGDWKSKADIAANRETNPSVVPAGRKGKGKEHATVSTDSIDNDGDAPQKPGRVRRLPSHLQEIPDDKPVRLNEQLRKCLAILREIGKAPSAHWFAQPVDWRFFELLDYPKIIKEPMDFATIKNRVESGDISSAEDFKKAVLLVFRNAMTYNVKRDNIVHVAAREIQALFEEKYRTQIESIPVVDKETEPSTDGRGRPGSGRGRKGGGSGKGRKGGKVSGKSDEDTKQKAVGQNSGTSGGGGMVPQARFVALQQQMELMQVQLETLKRQTSQTDLNMQAQMQGSGSSSSSSSSGRRTKELRPFTAQEKEALKNGISSLPQEKLPRVLQIIKERVAHVGERGEEEIEIDLDTLDPATLNDLQRYVKSCAPRKRKKPGQKVPDQSVANLLPSPGLLNDMDVDLSTLEDQALNIDINVDKRGRNSFDPILNYDPIPFTQGELPEGLESDSDE